MVGDNITDILCHDYIGVTVFNNSKTKYVKDFGTKEYTNKVFKVLAKKNGHKFVYVNSNELQRVHNYFTFSSWNGKPTLIPGKGEQVEKVMEKYNLDIIIFNSALAENECNMQYATGVMNNRGTVYAKKYFVAFKGQNLEYIGTKLGLGGVQATYEPANLKELNDRELDALRFNIESDILNGVRDLFKELNLGEFGYEERL